MSRTNRFQRRRINLLIAVVLIIHVLLPWRFYSGSSGNDERFCWRMFSTLQLNLSQSDVELSVLETRDGTKRTVYQQEVEERLPQPWISLLRRKQAGVVAGFERWWIERSGADSVQLMSTKKSATKGSSKTAR